MIAVFTPFFVLLAVVYTIFRLFTDRTNPATGEPSEGDAREFVARVFRLGLMAAAVALVAEGIAALLDELLPQSGDELARDSLRIAQALSFTIVGVPALFGLAWWTGRRLTADPDEEPSIVWAAYLGGMLTVALGIALLNIDQVLEWLVDIDEFSGRALGRALTWSAVFAVHWVLNQRRPLVDAYRAPERRTPMYLLVGSAIGLMVAAYGVWQFVRAVLRPLFDSVLSDVVASGSDEPIRLGIVHAILGLAVWVWFWWLHGLRSPRTERWYAYVLLIGVLSGLVITLSAAGLLLHSVLQWFFGDPDAGAAGAHFSSTPGAVAAAVVGVALWLHHRSVLGDRSAEIDVDQERSEVDRVYNYLVAFAGLVVTAIAVTTIVAAFLEAVSDPDVAGGSMANAIVFALTFLILGFPLWLLFWRQAEHQADRHPAEIHSPSRRVYVIGSLGVGAAVALVSLVVTLMILFEDIADGDFGSETVYRLRFPVGLLVSSLVVAVYHFLVYRQDRAAAPPPPKAPVVDLPFVVLVADLAGPDAAELIASLGARARRYAVDDSGPLPDQATVGAARGTLAAMSSRQALLTVRDGAITVEPLIDE